VPEGAPNEQDRVRTAELIGALSLATDFGIGVPLEYGLHSTLIAMRLAERLGIDPETASQTYFACLLFYVGCTAGAEVEARIFGEDHALTKYGAPNRFGSRPEMVAGLLRAVAPPGSDPFSRARQLVGGVPKLARALREQVAALCEVAQMLTDRLGLPPAVGALFGHSAERWDGHGQPRHARGDEIPLSMRIVHVARDAALQQMLGGTESAVRIVRDRAGKAFDPTIARQLADGAAEILAVEGDASAWDEVLACEPTPQLTLEGDAIDRALAAMGDFADLASPYLVGHSRGVAEQASAAAKALGANDPELVAIRRAAFVHDLGRVAVPVRIWQKPGPLTPDDWEKVRLHAYHTERILAPSSFLAELSSPATLHHERLDGSGYHRGILAAMLPRAARLLAAADAYHAMTEVRPYRPALPLQRAAEELIGEGRAGRLDPDAVTAVLEGSGQPPPRIQPPTGLTPRETEVVGLLARGLQTKQIARTLGISVKTADRHIQNAYAKIGVSTRAAATLFAMEHGLVIWGELPIPHPTARP
jgi:HD-GYP domain-containing protein (c-di-GMP phosphodiesterase class II)